MIIAVSKTPSREKFYNTLKAYYQQIDTKTGEITYNLEEYAFNLYCSISQLMAEAESKANTIQELLEQNNKLKRELEYYERIKNDLSRV